jgi:hypothetical protein
VDVLWLFSSLSTPAPQVLGPIPQSQGCLSAGEHPSLLRTKRGQAPCFIAFKNIIFMIALHYFYDCAALFL